MVYACQFVAISSCLWNDIQLLANVEAQATLLPATTVRSLAMKFNIEYSYKEICSLTHTYNDIIVSTYRMHKTICQTMRNASIQTSCHLMSETSTAAVNHYTDLSYFFNSHLACIEFIVNLIHNLYLSIVIASTERAQLPHLSKNNVTQFPFAASQSFQLL